MLIIMLTATAEPMIFDSAKADPYSMIPEHLPTEQGYIRSDGSIEPSTLPIQHDGNIYRLTDNIINYTFDIERNDTIFDGNGFSLSVPAYGEVGENGRKKMANPLISLRDMSNVLIENVDFYKYAEAIYVENSFNIILFKNTLSSGLIGIETIRSSDCSIVANHVSDNSRDGIRIKDCTSFNISYNRMSHNTNGIFFWSFTSNIFEAFEHSNITRNLFSENDYGLSFSCEHKNNRIFENNFINNDIGLDIEGSPKFNNSFSNNYWMGNRINTIDHFEGYQDPSPLMNQVSTEFDQPPFTLPYISDIHITLQLNQTSLLEIATIAVCAVAFCVGITVYFKKYRRYKSSG